MIEGAMNFCFRIHFKMADRVKIQTDDRELTFHDLVDGTQVVLVAVATEMPLPPIGERRNLALRGAGYPTEEAAREAAKRWRSVLQSAFARFALGADFGDRAARSAFTEAGLQILAQQTGRRVLNDVHGTMTFECDPPPVFLGWQPTLIRGQSPDGIRRAIDAALAAGQEMTPLQQLAYDLYGGSFFQTSPDARFAMLMMAVETLIEIQPRSDQARAHVTTLIDATNKSGLEPSEVASLVGALSYLRNESINQAGRRLARSLGDRRYQNEPPEEFFSACYQLRGRLFHGAFPRPSRMEVDTRSANLEHFVGHLICGNLVDAVAD